MARMIAALRRRFRARRAEAGEGPRCRWCGELIIQVVPTYTYQRPRWVHARDLERTRYGPGGAVHDAETFPPTAAEYQR